MKNLLLCLIALLIFNISSLAQAPEKFKYQAHIMNEKGSVVNNTTIGLQLSIYQNGLNGNLVYQEVFSTTTNKSGLVNLEIGMGNATFGIFSEINWGLGPYFLEAAIDLKGGNNYVSIGASQLLSVPYALYAKKAEFVEGDFDTDPTNEIELPETANENDILTYIDGAWVPLSSTDNFNFFYADRDLDGFGDPWNLVYAHNAPDGYIKEGGDCNDTDHLIFPGATDIPEDGIDQDCNGTDAYYDNDNDGFTSNVDCDDNDASINPDAEEICDGKDNNCDGIIDGCALVTTSNLFFPTWTSANFRGSVEIPNDGITPERGFCWSESPNPTIDDNQLNLGYGTGFFQVVVETLSPSTTYYVKAFAINSSGVSYGNEVNFSTKDLTIPSVSTSPVSSITSTSAVSGGFIQNNGGDVLTARGVVWGSTSNPTISDNKTVDWNDNGYGIFVSSISGLTTGETYYVRAYATNSVGTGYGNEYSFIATPSVQERLDAGGTPKEIYDSGIQLHELYGHEYQGGLIFYLNRNDGSGLVAAPSDQSNGIQWYNGERILTGATGYNIGTGQDNTNAIVTTFGSGDYAAQICNDLVLNGYDDWFLPSYLEFSEMDSNIGLSAYGKNSNIGGFSRTRYWSSTEQSVFEAWYYDFGNRRFAYNLTSASYRVRAIRAF